MEISYGYMNVLRNSNAEMGRNQIRDLNIARYFSLSSTFYPQKKYITPPKSCFKSHYIQLGLLHGYLM